MYSGNCQQVDSFWHVSAKKHSLDRKINTFNKIDEMYYKFNIILDQPLWQLRQRGDTTEHATDTLYSLWDIP
jgi:predicted restriction endonuclease